MLLLPTRSTRTSRRAFAIVLGIGMGAGLAAILSVSGLASNGTALMVTGAVILGTTLLALMFPYDIALPYRAWNRLVRTFSVHAIRYVTAVCFWTVIQALRWRSVSGRFEAVPQAGSTWRRRGTQPSQTYGEQYSMVAAPNRSSSSLRQWMKEAGTPLAWALLPFIAVLRALDAAPHDWDAANTNIYTLY
jgi:hypothetical protein